MPLDLHWLDEFVRDLPAPTKHEPTLFDTMGVSTRENTISTVLAYFLNETNPHGLGRLFLDSLLDCMNEQSAHFPSPYTVERERHRIDILIRATDRTWAVVLENKVFHYLANPLDTYFHKVPTGRTVGVVVSLQPLAGWEALLRNFANVTHMAWLDRVEQVRRESQPVWPADDAGRNKLIYNDLRITMANNTASITDDPETNKTIGLFQQQHAAINKLLDAKNRAENYIQSHINAVFKSNGFKRAGSHYLPDDNAGNAVRFFVVDTILLSNRLGVYFELYGHAVALGDVLKPLIADAVRTQGLVAPDSHFLKRQYYHLAEFKPDSESVITSDQDSLYERLQNLIGRFFAENETLGMSLVDYCRRFTLQNATSTNE
ncbi:hypothetical protein GCM10027578_27580 [Spirosoma luteolum]